MGKRRNVKVDKPQVEMQRRQVRTLTCHKAYVLLLTCSFRTIQREHDAAAGAGASTSAAARWPDDTNQSSESQGECRS